MSFASLNDILGSKKQQRNAAFDEVTLAFNAFKKVAQETLPKNFHDLYTIGHLEKGTLYIEVESAAHAHALSLYRHTLLRKMAMTNNKILISDIRISQKRKQPQ